MDVLNHIANLTEMAWNLADILQGEKDAGRTLSRVYDNLKKDTVGDPRYVNPENNYTSVFALALMVQR